MPGYLCAGYRELFHNLLVHSSPQVKPVSSDPLMHKYGDYLKSSHAALIKISMKTCWGKTEYKQVKINNLENKFEV